MVATTKVGRSSESIFGKAKGDVQLFRRECEVNFLDIGIIDGSDIVAHGDDEVNYGGLGTEF